MSAVLLLIVLIALAAVALIGVVVGLTVSGRRKAVPPAGPAPEVIVPPPSDADVAEPTVDVPADVAPALEKPEGTASRLVRLRQRLAGSQSGLGRGLLALLSRDRLDEDTWEAIEALLLTADIGVAPTRQLVEGLRTRLRVRAAALPT